MIKEIIASSSITIVIEVYVKRFLEIYKAGQNYYYLPHPTFSVEDINGGDCVAFAILVQEKIPKAQFAETSYAGGHVWLILNAKNYDAENPNGVKDWRMLSSDFKKLPAEAFDIRSLKEIKKKWRVSDGYLNRYRIKND